MSRVVRTPYIEWAKRAKRRWNLSVSGVPPATWNEITDGATHIPLAGDNSYGYAPLLERIAARYRVEPSEVVTATGCSMANYLTLAALVQPGDEVLIEQPTYEPLLLAALHLGATVTRFEREPARAFALAADDVIAKISRRTRAVIITNLHNPSSQHVADEVLRAIGEAALDVGARVIVDEVYLDAERSDSPPCCVHLGPAFVSTSSLTKIYGLSALRCGWVIADQPLARHIWEINDLYENVRPFIPDWLSVAAFDRLEMLGTRSRALLATNRRQFADWLGGRADVECTVPASGTTVCLRPLAVAADRLCEEVDARYDVTIVPGRFFEVPDYVRIALSTDTMVLREGLTRIGACLDALAAESRDA